jgi:ParB-like chromosome segregation protein Spo0J
MTETSLIPEIDVFNLPVFPVAALFPMIAADELAELAEDIRENGLQEPIVIAKPNGEWLLVDGRNRLAACQLAGITPHYRILDSDPTAYVLSANVHRRHLTKGQQAMAVR